MTRCDHTGNQMETSLFITIIFTDFHQAVGYWTYRAEVSRGKRFIAIHCKNYSQQKIFSLTVGLVQQSLREFKSKAKQIIFLTSLFNKPKSSFIIGFADSNQSIEIFNKILLYKYFLAENKYISSRFCI